MLKKKEIADGNFVYDMDNNTYHQIIDVNNAIEVGDRDSYNSDKDELSYTIVNVITDESLDGVCEHSGITQALRIASVEEILLRLASLEANGHMKLAKVKKELANLQEKIYLIKKNLL